MKSLRTIISAGFLASALALAGCGGGGESTPAGPTEAEKAEMQAEMAAKAALMAAADAATELVQNTDATAEEVSSVSDLIMAARGMVDDLPDAEQDAAMDTLDAAQGVVDVHEERLRLAAANQETQDELDDLEQANKDREEDEKRRMEEEAMKAMAAMAAKLYAGIAAQSGAIDTSTAAGSALAAATERGAAYNNEDVPSAETAVNTRIMVGIGTDAPVALSEDKDAMVDALHGWEGKKYVDPAGGDSYEAVVYSNVGEPTEGDKFSTHYSANFADGELAATIVTNTDNSGRVSGSSFDHTSGVKRFPLPDPNPGGATIVSVSGSFHGVSGTYMCTPGASAVCAARVAGEGFELGTVPSATDATWTAGSTQWTFKPTDPATKVMSVPDTVYASYGWWLRKSENDATYTASAFTDEHGAVPAGNNPADLNGSAKYKGGAAGKYALASSTGGTNDAGHFTADAELDANFSDNTISGTIKNFMDAEGESRNWSVKLQEAAVSTTGVITRTGTDQTNNDTVWTIDDNPAAASGSWEGNLWDPGADGVPQAATGAFYSEYGTAGRMVGAFGANAE